MHGLGISYSKVFNNNSVKPSTSGEHDGFKYGLNF